MNDATVAPGRPDRRKVSISMETLAQLRPIAEQAGVPIPGLIQFQAKLDIDEPDTEIARQLGALCSKQPIFRRGDDIVALDDEGQMVPMTAKRFGGWCEKFVTTFKTTKDRGEHAASMVEALAGRILVNDAFTVQVRRLLYYFPVRLPVLRKVGGVEQVVLLEPGYDEESESWTEDSIPYEEDWDWDRAVDWVEQVLGEWPWADLVTLPEKDRTLSNSRNASVILSGMLGVFCRAFFGAGQRRPMVIVSGSGVGTGKTTLCKMMMAPVYGLPPELDLPRADDKFTRLLESTALGYEPYMFLDDVGVRLKSNALNKFVTASWHAGTTLYAQRLFKVPNVTQVFASGIDLKFDHNIDRRAMVCELFLPGEVQGREFKYEVTDDLLGTAGWRSEALSAMWCIVKEWHARKLAGALGVRKVLKSFESYSRRVCAMMEVMGWRDPLDTPEMITGGDTESRDFRALLHALARGQQSEVEDYSTEVLVEKARELNLLDEVVGVKSDGPLKKGDRISFGRRLEKFRGKVYQREDGVFFQFGKRDGKGGSVYPCRLAHKAGDLF